MHKSGDAQSVERFLILNGVSAHQYGTGFHDLVGAALQDLSQNPRIQAIREPDNVQCDLGLAAHRVHIAESISRGNCAESVRVIDNRRKEIDGLDHSDLIIYFVDSRII